MPARQTAQNKPPLRGGEEGQRRTTPVGDDALGVPPLGKRKHFNFTTPPLLSPTLSLTYNAERGFLL